MCTLHPINMSYRLLPRLASATTLNAKAKPQEFIVTRRNIGSKKLCTASLHPQTVHRHGGISSRECQSALNSFSGHQRMGLHTSTFLNHGIKNADSKDGSVEISWVGENECWKYPYPWLRENCPCPTCYDTLSFTRLLTLEDWDQNDSPVHIEVCDDEKSVEVKWKSGHVSNYEACWLREHGFTDTARRKKRSMLALKKELWAHKLDISKHDYNDVTTKDEALFNFLVSLEKMGVVLVTGAPREPKAAFNIVNKIGFAKQTHYGLHYPIRNKLGANSLAYTDNKLGMHNDLPYFNYVPGIIFLHCITQFEGEGGENDLADGYQVAKYIKQNYPEQYELLARTPVYFFNKGKAMVQQETTEFYKLLSTPIIVEDPVSREVIRLNFSQLRHSFFDVPPDVITKWYSALRLFHNTMHQQAIRNKLNSGEMLVMDNTRLLHGRTAYNGALGERYMDQVYLDWDVALSKRRVLQEKLGVDFE